MSPTIKLLFDLNYEGKTRYEGSRERSEQKSQYCPLNTYIGDFGNDATDLVPSVLFRFFPGFEEIAMIIEQLK